MPNMSKAYQAFIYRSGAERFEFFKNHGRKAPPQADAATQSEATLATQSVVPTQQAALPQQAAPHQQVASYQQAVIGRDVSTPPSKDIIPTLTVSRTRKKGVSYNEQTTTPTKQSKVVHRAQVMDSGSAIEVARVEKSKPAVSEIEATRVEKRKPAVSIEVVKVERFKPGVAAIEVARAEAANNTKAPCPTVLFPTAAVGSAKIP